MEQNINLVSIDAGASKKINELAEYLYSKGYKNINIIQCNKKRNIKNGNIESFEVFKDNLDGVTTIIVDDIADGGESFIYAAKELIEKNAGNLYLVVSHGIFSKGLKELSKYFKQVYTTDSWRSEFSLEQQSRDNTELVKIIKLKKIL